MYHRFYITRLNSLLLLRRVQLYPCIVELSVHDDTNVGYDGHACRNADIQWCNWMLVASQ